SGLEAAVLKAASAGTLVFGICGGYQMLGRTVSDPDQVEAAGTTEIQGLELLDMDTVFQGEKVQTQVSGTFDGMTGLLSFLNGMDYTGYEIHMGRSQEKLPPLQGTGNVYGSYIHGIFDAPGVSDQILRAICTKKGLDFAALGTFDLQEYKGRQYDLLADVVRGGLDMELIYRIINREV
ncbi:MAG: cobyric acid synthase CobQ, partial [Clostridiales bacterium]|nr:cobyric acid synthase CobQ [Clostridiales bacterium]